MEGFKAKLQFGQEAEARVGRWLNKKGCSVFHLEKDINNKENKEFEGPRLKTPFGDFISPDLLAYAGNHAFLAEVKHMSAFAWSRKKQKWVTGMKYDLFSQYYIVDKISPFKVYLFFLQEKGQAKDSMPSPNSGLFVGGVDCLARCVADRWPDEPSKKPHMIYWDVCSLEKKATLEDL